MGALDEISRRAVRAVEMLVIGEVPERLLKRVVKRRLMGASESKECGVFF